MLIQVLHSALLSLILSFITECQVINVHLLDGRYRANFLFETILQPQSQYDTQHHRSHLLDRSRLSYQSITCQERLQWYRLYSYLHCHCFGFDFAVSMAFITCIKGSADSCLVDFSLSPSYCSPSDIGECFERLEFTQKIKKRPLLSLKGDTQWSCPTRRERLVWNIYEAGFGKTRKGKLE